MHFIPIQTFIHTKYRNTHKCIIFMIFYQLINTFDIPVCLFFSGIIIISEFCTRPKENVSPTSLTSVN